MSDDDGGVIVDAVSLVNTFDFAPNCYLLKVVHVLVIVITFSVQGHVRHPRFWFWFLLPSG